MQGVFNDWIGGFGRLDVIDFDGFAFELFVILEKAAEHGQAVRGHFAGFAVDVELGVFGGDGDDFVVFFAAVDHGHQADGADAGMRVSGATVSWQRTRTSSGSSSSARVWGTKP